VLLHSTLTLFYKLLILFVLTEYLCKVSPTEGKPEKLLMKIVSLPIEWLDVATTKNSYEGKLLGMMGKRD
jgi:hypothetical protein